MAKKADKPEIKPVENPYKVPRRFADDEPIVDVPPESKSWEEYDFACKRLLEKAKNMQGKLESMVKDWADLEAEALQAYKKMPNTDAMFSDSPLSHLRLQNSFRQNLAKLGWRWAMGLPWGPDVVKPFFDVVKDACTWGERIVKDQQRAEKIEAAKKLAEKATNDITKII